MKTVKFILVCALLALWDPMAALAAAGGTAMDFLRLDVGSRQMGRGGVGVAMEGDVYDMAYNPAWLGRMEARQLALSHVNWMQGIQYQDLLVGLPLRFGGLGLRLQNLNYGKIASYDDAGLPTGSLSAADNLFGLGFGKTFLESRLALGGGVKLAKERIGDASAWAKVLDAGALLKPWQEGRLSGLSLGFAVRNLGKGVRFDAATEPLPVTADLGVGLDFPDQALRLGGDMHLPATQAPYGNAGLEFRLHPRLELRAGFETGQAQGPGLRAGLGLRLGAVQCNYAISPMGALGLTHHVGLVFRWGEKPRDASAARYWRGDRYVLDETVFFESGSAELGWQASQALSHIARELKRTEGQILIGGHTDNATLLPGSVYASNWELSLARAGTVMRSLEAHGVPSARIRTKGHGPMRPVASNDTETGRARNRRIEISVRGAESEGPQVGFWRLGPDGR